VSSPIRDKPGVYRAFNGTVLHLYLPGFHPSAHTRAVANVGLCGQQAWDCWKAPTVWFDEPPTLGLPYRWCGKCIGLALVHTGQATIALDAIRPYFTTTTPLEPAHG
jgi:hypothetical protein